MEVTMCLTWQSVRDNLSLEFEKNKGADQPPRRSAQTDHRHCFSLIAKYSI